MNNKKTWITLGTVLVVAIAIFAGVKLLNAPKDTNQTISLNDEVKDQSKKDKENKTEEKKEDKQTNNDKSNDKKVDDKKVDDKKGTSETLNKTDKTETQKEEKPEDKDKSQSNKIDIFDDEYTVQKGDTLYSIARKVLKDVNNAEAVDLIKKVNNLDENSVIVVGSKLIIPTEDNFKTAKADENKGTAYVVKKGDTLSSIAESHINWCSNKEGIQLIMENNDLKTPEALMANQTIYIPEQK